jgi:hypothetical protein
MTSEEFLDLACKLALDHKERMVNDAQFHPLLRERGLSASEIESLTATLAARGEIERHRFVGGFADFEIAKPVFIRYVLRPLPATTANQALELCRAWRQPGGGDATAERLATELSLSPFVSVILFHDCMSRLQT